MIDTLYFQTGEYLFDKWLAGRRARRKSRNGCTAAVYAYAAKAGTKEVIARSKETKQSAAKETRAAKRCSQNEAHLYILHKAPGDQNNGGPSK